MDRNRSAWAAYDESWPDESDFNLDGYTLMFEMDLVDTNAVNVCI